MTGMILFAFLERKPDNTALIVKLSITGIAVACFFIVFCRKKCQSWLYGGRLLI
jgi:hypothetical protein